MRWTMVLGGFCLVFKMVWTMVFDCFCWFLLVWTMVFDRFCWFLLVWTIVFVGFYWFGQWFCDAFCVVLLVPWFSHLNVFLV